MTETFDTKPEPISAKPNWHYDTYYLSQLERLNLLRTPVSTTPIPKAELIDYSASDNRPPETKTDTDDSCQPDTQFNDHDEVIRCINELAASIGASVRIIEPSK
jgi:hypothetical protein